MALELCIESTGWIAQFAHANGWESMATLVRSGASTRRNTSTPITGGPAEDDRLGQAIRGAAAGLPFELAQALWLVDVCGLTYAEAARVTRVERETIAERITLGRRAIREAVFPVER